MYIHIAKLDLDRNLIRYLFCNFMKERGHFNRHIVDVHEYFSITLSWYIFELKRQKTQVHEGTRHSWELQLLPSRCVYRKIEFFWTEKFVYPKHGKWYLPCVRVRNWNLGVTKLFSKKSCPLVLSLFQINNDSLVNAKLL